MAKKKPRTLDIGKDGSVRLPDDVMRALDLAPGEKVEIYLDTRRKAVRLERHVDDPWAEAMKQKPEKGFDDLMTEQQKREAEAERIWKEKLKEGPGERKPEDDPDRWR
jgi:antitoxin component of MazEF toxin-antitoxin module